MIEGQKIYKRMLKSFVPIVLCLSMSFGYSSVIKESKTVLKDSSINSEFVALSLLISNFPEFMEEWENTEFEHAPNAKVVDKAKIGDTLHLISLFSGCLPNVDNICKLSFKIKQFKDKKLTSNSVKYYDNPIYQTGFQKLNSHIGLTFEDNDKGIYSYEVTITDENAKKTINIKNSIMVTD